MQVITNYAQVTGSVDDIAVVAIVRRDGSVRGDPVLLRRARLAAADRACARGVQAVPADGTDPLATTLELARACTM